MTLAIPLPTIQAIRKLVPRNRQTPSELSTGSFCWDRSTIATPSMNVATSLVGSVGSGGSSADGVPQMRSLSQWQPTSIM